MINAYNGTGQKLRTKYYTAITPVIVPVNTIHGGYSASDATLRLDDYFGSVLYENGTAEDAAHHPLTKLLTPEGYVDYATGGKPYCYFRKDHLGSIREVDTYQGPVTVLQKTQYYPSGTPFQESFGAGVQPYKFTGKEMITMHGLNWQDFGARWLDNVRMQWTSIDPLAEKYYSISPYAYCANNPGNLIDPDGMDWVFSKKNGYQWLDNVTSAKNTPKDYQYVGSQNSDILTHMGVSSQYETKIDNSNSIGVVGGDSKGPAGEGTVGSENSDVKATVRIDTNVGTNKKNITDNNKSGKTFNGIAVSAYVSEKTQSSSDDISNSYGVFKVDTEIYMYSNGLFEQKGSDQNGSIYKTPGIKATTSTILIPASEIRSSNYLQSATVTIGRPDPSKIYAPTTSIQFNLQTHTNQPPNK